LQLHLSEQDVIDACAVYVANRHRTRPEDVLIDLAYEPGIGFFADAKFGWSTVRLTEQNLVDAIAEFLAEYHNFNPHQLNIQLQFPEDANRIEAYIVVL
jgi:hypothetical protein